jgi:hypothetical protein
MSSESDSDTIGGLNDDYYTFLGVDKKVWDLFYFLTLKDL